MFLCAAEFYGNRAVSLLQCRSSSLARQPLVGPDLLKKFCPFVSVEGDFLPILDPHILA